MLSQVTVSEMLVLAVAPEVEQNDGELLEHNGCTGWKQICFLPFASNVCYKISNLNCRNSQPGCRAENCSATHDPLPILLHLVTGRV